MSLRKAIKKATKQISGIFRDKPLKPYTDINQITSNALSNKITPINFVSIVNSEGLPKIQQYRDTNGTMKITVNDKDFPLTPIVLKDKKQKPEKVDYVAQSVANAITAQKEAYELAQDYKNLAKLAPEAIPFIQQRLNNINETLNLMTDRIGKQSLNKIQRVLEANGQLKNSSAIEYYLRNADEMSLQYRKNNIDLMNLGNSEKSNLLSYIDNSYKMSRENTNAILQTGELALKQDELNLRQDQLDLADDQQRMDAQIANNQISLGQLQTYTNTMSNNFDSANTLATSAREIDNRQLAEANQMNLHKHIQNKDPFKKALRATMTKAGSEFLGSMTNGSPGNYMAEKLKGMFNNNTNNNDVNANNTNNNDVNANNQFYQWYQQNNQAFGSNNQRGGTGVDIAQQGARMAANAYYPGSGEVLNSIANAIRKKR